MTILPIAYILFVVNFLYGVLVATGAIERGRWRKVHHFLYLLTVLGIIAVVLQAILRNPSRIVVSAGMLLLLLGMPRFHGGTRGHTAYALLLLGVYSVIMFAL